MSLNVRPHAWWIPIGLFAVIGPSRKEKRGPPRFWATRCEKTCSRSQNSRVAVATATKSSGPGVANMLVSPCLCVERPGGRCRETKRPPGTLTAVGYVRVMCRPSAQRVLRGHGGAANLEDDQKEEQTLQTANGIPTG